MATLVNDVKDKINRYFIENLGLYDYRRGWLRGDCPSCGAHKYGVNLTLNRTNCFRCGYNLKPIEVILEVEKLETKIAAYKFINTFEGLEYYKAPLEVKDLKESTTLPENYRNIKRGKSVYSNKARNYLTARGFNLDELSQKGIGYCTAGKYFGYIIIPFYLQGKLIYFNARNFTGYGSKFNNPLVEDFGLGKSMLMYNMDSLFIYKKCYLFESATNCLTIGDNSFAIGGKKISAYQLNHIIKSPCKKIIIGLDKDGWDDAIKIAFKLQQFKKVKIMVFEDDKDVNDLGKNKSKKIERNSPYLDYKSIIKLKNELQRAQYTYN